MARDGWHILREPGAVTLARRLPARFDLSAETAFPATNPAVLVHEVRKDLWRALRRVRGFSPVVRVADREGGRLTVRAGGAISGQMPPLQATEARIAALLADPARRARWRAHAGRPRR